MKSTRQVFLPRGNNLIITALLGAMVLLGFGLIPLDSTAGDHPDCGFALPGDLPCDTTRF